jgi:transposase IS4 family protein
MRIQDEDFKIFEIIKPFQHFKQEAAKNLLSIKGVEIRVNRSIQVEGVFGVQKQNYKNDKFRRRSLTKESTEAMLNFLGFNIAKLFRYYEKNTLNDFWIAPENLIPQTFKKGAIAPFNSVFFESFQQPHYSKI